jgi:cell division septum initiation protein DivIVA
MEFSPQSVANKSFEIVKKGYEPVAVKKYLVELAAAIETSQNESAAMEARARAAVARLQELANQPSTSAPTAAPSTVVAPVVAAPPAALAGPSVSESETISRTLLLAQRTADATVAESESEAKRVSFQAKTEADSLVQAARLQAAKMVEDAKAQARQAGDGERQNLEAEVNSLLARREFLISDVEHLEQHIVTHRERLRDVIGSLQDIVGKAPGGLADLRRPLVSAVDKKVGEPAKEDTQLIPVTEPDVEAASDAADDSADELALAEGGETK